MNNAFGIVYSSSRNVKVEGMQDYRSIGAFSFLGRYRVIDFPISNMSNSDIDRIQVYVDNKPRSLVEHVGTGRHYNINSKSGRLHLLFNSASRINSIYDTDIAAYMENMEYILRMHNPYVVIAPNYMIYTMNYATAIDAHIESGADITMLYHAVDNAKEKFLNCFALDLNRQKGVLSIERNNGNAKNRNISLDTYIMKTELFVELVKKAAATSSMYSLADIINEECSELDIRGYAHRGFFASITDFESYYDANLSLIDYKSAQNLFHEDWPIYTRTNDSCPTHYFDSSDVRHSIVSNGCSIHGTIENSIIGRGVVVEEGAVIRNSIILGGCVIGKNVHLENQVVDKQAKIIHGNEIIAPEGHPAYVRRGDVL